MPRLDLLLFPLLGGYLFLISFKITKFYHQRIERQRLIFNALIAAIFLTILALAFDRLILQIPYIQPIRNWFISLNPYTTLPGLNFSLLIFFLALPLAWGLNILLPNKASMLYVVERWGNQIELLFWKSLNAKKDSEKLLMLTTKSNKVYIAYINRISDPIGDPFVTLIPNLSGFREKNTLELIITTNYIEVLKHFIDENKVHLIDEKLGVTIPIAEISMVSKFDFDIFKGYFNKSEPNSSV